MKNKCVPFFFIYHEPWDNYKYVSPDWHLEAVYDDETGNIVEDLSVLGTFNFFSPDDFFGHKDADVDPYRHWSTN
jgi:hypothetical protein